MKAGVSKLPKVYASSRLRLCFSLLALLRTLLLLQLPQLPPPLEVLGLLQLLLTHRCAFRFLLGQPLLLGSLFGRVVFCFLLGVGSGEVDVDCFASIE